MRCSFALVCSCLYLTIFTVMGAYSDPSMNFLPNEADWKTWGDVNYTPLACRALPRAEGVVPVAVGGVSAGRLGVSAARQVIVELMDASGGVQTPSGTGRPMPAVLLRGLHQDCMSVRNHTVCFPITPAVRDQRRTRSSYTSCVLMNV